VYYQNVMRLKMLTAALHGCETVAEYRTFFLLRYYYTRLVMPLQLKVVAGPMLCLVVTAVISFLVVIGYLLKYKDTFNDVAYLLALYMSPTLELEAVLLAGTMLAVVKALEIGKEQSRHQSVITVLAVLRSVYKEVGGG
jgi:hypothetical protein